jgi:hypothetical protein
MKKALLVMLALVPLAGCAHEQAGYAGGPGFFYGDCLDLYEYGCDYGLSRRYYYGYGIPGEPVLSQRARVTKLERKTSTHVVRRGQTPPSPTRAASAPRSAPARSAPAAASSHSAPAAHVSHSGSHR